MGGQKFEKQNLPSNYLRERRFRSGSSFGFRRWSSSTVRWPYQASLLQSKASYQVTSYTGLRSQDATSSLLVSGHWVAALAISNISPNKTQQHSKRYRMRLIRLALWDRWRNNTKCKRPWNLKRFGFSENFYQQVKSKPKLKNLSFWHFGLWWPRWGCKHLSQMGCFPYNKNLSSFDLLPKGVTIRTKVKSLGLCPWPSHLAHGFRTHERDLHNEIPQATLAKTK